jgi:hypothetical protein
MALEVLETLSALGVTVRVIPPNTLRLEPASKVPADLLPRIRESKPAILKVLHSSPAIALKPAKPGQCTYDWQAGYRGLRLHCVAHQHAAGTATVFVMRWAGHDTFREMADLGILSGQALEDARRVQ